MANEDKIKYSSGKVEDTSEKKEDSTKVEWSPRFAWTMDLFKSFLVIVLVYFTFDSCERKREARQNDIASKKQQRDLRLQILVEDRIKGAISDINQFKLYSKTFYDFYSGSLNSEEYTDHENRSSYLHLPVLSKEFQYSWAKIELLNLLNLDEKYHGKINFNEKVKNINKSLDTLLVYLNEANWKNRRAPHNLENTKKQLDNFKLNLDALHILLDEYPIQLLNSKLREYYHK